MAGHAQLKLLALSVNIDAPKFRSVKNFFLKKAHENYTTRENR